MYYKFIHTNTNTTHTHACPYTCVSINKYSIAMVSFSNTVKCNVIVKKKFLCFLYYVKYLYRIFQKSVFHEIFKEKFLKFVKKIYEKNSPNIKKCTSCFFNLVIVINKFNYIYSQSNFSRIMLK